MSDPRAGWVPAIGVLLAGALVVAAYWPGLAGPLVLDDFFHVQPLITPGVPEPAHWWAPLAGHAGPTGRPIAMLSFLAQAAVNGDDLWYWKLTNVILHLGVGALLAVVVAQILATGRERVGAGESRMAAVVALLWLVHPLQVGTVLYVVQRMTLLASLFSLAAIALYLQARRRYEFQRPGALGCLLATWLVATPLAVFSKETGVLVPLVCIATEVTLWRGSGALARWRALQGSYLLAALAAAAVVIGAFATGMVRDLADGYAARPYGLGERLLTQARVWWLYVAQVLVPVPALFGFMHNDIPISTGLFAPPATAISLVAWAAVAVGLWSLRRREPVIAFAGLWFLIGHSLEGSVLPLELMFEHRNYLPSAALLLALIVGFSRLRLGRAAYVGLFALGTAVGSALTWWHAGQWRSEETLYAYILRHHPQSPWAVGMVAEWLSQHGAYTQARALLAATPNPANALHQLSIECRAGSALGAAPIERLRTELGAGIDGYSGPVLAGLAQLVVDGACAVPAPEFRQLLDAALERRFTTGRSRFKVLLLRARLAQADGDIEAALRNLESAHALRAEDPMPLLLAAEFLAERPDLERARAYLARARAITAQSAWDYGAVIDAVAAMVGPDDPHE